MTEKTLADIQEEGALAKAKEEKENNRLYAEALQKIADNPMTIKGSIEFELTFHGNQLKVQTNSKNSDVTTLVKIFGAMDHFQVIQDNLATSKGKSLFSKKERVDVIITRHSLEKAVNALAKRVHTDSLIRLHKEQNDQTQTPKNENPGNNQ